MQGKRLMSNFLILKILASLKLKANLCVLQTHTRGFQTGGSTRLETFNFGLFYFEDHT